MAIVVVGLAISAPPSSTGLRGDHFGALLHPIFPHDHGNGHTFAGADPLSDLASHEPASKDVAPGLSVPQAESAAREAASGMALTFTLAVIVLGFSRRHQPSDPILLGRPVSPPTPPPRMLASVI